MDVDSTGLNDLVMFGGRLAADAKQMAFLGGDTKRDVPIYSSGRLDLLKQKIVAIVGSRAASMRSETSFTIGAGTCPGGGGRVEWPCKGY